MSRPWRRTPWSRFLSYPWYRNIAIIFLAVSIAFSSIILAGCTSTNMNNVYLLSLSYTNDSSPTSHYDSDQVNPNISSTFASLASTNTNRSPSLEIRAGYMGFCMPDLTGDWICSRHASSLAKTINETKSMNGDPLNLIWIAKEFQSQIMFVGLMFSTIPVTFISLFLLFIIPNRKDRHDSNKSGSSNSNDDSNGCENDPGVNLYPVLASLTLASLLTFVAVFWQHIVSSAVVTMGHNLSYRTVKGKVGIAAMVLGWAAVFLDILAAVVILIVILYTNATKTVVC